MTGHRARFLRHLARGADKTDGPLSNSPEFAR
ncbi:hypothetical protein SacmaDRAFT_4550 [Saccharomonospora marina XMU15]|uniref:Uncharacterized protein n=1 Tax=Saccharomonospora marina XMU15 TaxID=882083 RepID=H5XBU6_9PSEU|nr:hypothetical protein SacmaDRAFT_4550 [Saccharomonospora marina XMU15]